MARRGLVLCATDDERVTAIVERILERAEKLQDDADHLADINVTWGRWAGGSAELRWAASLLLGEIEGGEG